MRQIGNFSPGRVTAKQAIDAGLSVDNMMEVIGDLRSWMSMAAYITAFTSNRVAHLVFNYSQRRVPYDTGELYDSGYVDTVAGAELGGKLTKLTVIEENAEGTPDFIAVNLRDIQPGFSLPSNVGVGGMRTYNKYAVGYTADHSSIVHENPYGMQFNQGAVSRSGRPVPHANHRKMDHFLLNAYHAYASRYSNAMRMGIEQLNAQFRSKSTARAMAKSGLSPGKGPPRLIPKKK